MSGSHAAIMKITIFWDVVPYSLVEIDYRFRELIRVITLVMKAVSTTETSVSFYKTARRNDPEDRQLCCKLRLSGPEKSRLPPDHEIFIFINKSLILKSRMYILVSASDCKF